MRLVKAAEVRTIDPRVTFAELQQWPDDGLRYELYDGEVIVVPLPFPRHQRVAMNVGEILREYERRVGGTAFAVAIDIVFTDHNALQPDAVYFSEARRQLIEDWKVTRAAPDLAVEILSRSTEVRDRGRKMQMYERFGVPECWIVDPARNTLEVYVLRGADYELAIAAGANDDVTSPTLSNLSFSTSRISAE
jgi:Uma2 family endonuclease